jgi:hypothetical protein
MAYYNPGQPEVRNGCPMPPYNSPQNPNYSTFANQPQFPLDAGSNTKQVQQNVAALGYFTALNQRVNAVVTTNFNSGTKLPYPTFKSQGERIFYIQGQMIANAKAIAAGQVAISTIYDYINSS